MYVKLIFLISFLIKFAVSASNHQEWDLAVVVHNQIKFMLSNGTKIDPPYNQQQLQFTKLKALTYDAKRDQLIVVNEDKNDTIYTVQLTNKTEIISAPIIPDLPHDIMGLAIDTVDDILYWTDSISQTINFVALNDSEYESQLLLSFADKKPQYIAIDICNRSIYWTNSMSGSQTIERIKIGSNESEVIIDTGLHIAAGLAIDYISQRLVWTIREGIYYRLESSDLHGKNRQTLDNGSGLEPFDLAIDTNAIYWTDLYEDSVWSLPIDAKDSAAQQLCKFTENEEHTPKGIVARNAQISSHDQCSLLLDKQSEKECNNYCVNGKCSISKMGARECWCFAGFDGKRCENEMCKDFCLNDGECMIEANQPKCKCKMDYKGERCEMKDYCEFVCKGGVLESRISNNGATICRCTDDSETTYNVTYTVPMELQNRETNPFLIDRLQDTEFLVMSAALLFAIILIIGLSCYICALRRRPRIRKRIIVNKNVTPLTYVPASEQCEITIENCCNMNICETPCFEPPQLSCRQGKGEDKKKLLANMENSEDLY